MRWINGIATVNNRVRGIKIGTNDDFTGLYREKSVEGKIVIEQIFPITIKQKFDERYIKKRIKKELNYFNPAGIEKFRVTYHMGLWDR